MNNKADQDPSVAEKEEKKKQSKEKNSSVSNDSSNTDSKSNTSNLLSILSLVGLVILAIVLVYFVQKGKQELADLKQAEQSQISSFSDLKEAISNLKQDEEVQTGSVNQLKQKQTALEDSLAKLFESKPDSNLEWTLMEAEYLIVIAMHRLLLERDVKTAITALETADRRLKDVANPGLIPVREQITHDLNALKGVELVDITGLSLFLSDLITRAESLPLKKQKLFSAKEDDEAEESVSEELDWKAMPNLMWEELKSLVVIKHKDEEGAHFLLPEEEYYLYQNLRLQLESAKLSVLKLDNDNFVTSIDIIQNWLKRHFEQEAAEVKNVVDTLGEMRKVNLKPKLPEVNSSLETLRAYIRNLDAEGSAQ